jgi:hypothetical protein
MVRVTRRGAKAAVADENAEPAQVAGKRALVSSHPAVEELRTDGAQLPPASHAPTASRRAWTTDTWPGRTRHGQGRSSAANRSDLARSACNE